VADSKERERGGELHLITQGLSSPLWQRLSQDYDKKLREMQAQLEGCDDTQLRRIQGWCAALKWVLRQPDEILRKLREDVKEDGTASR